MTSEAVVARTGQGDHAITATSQPLVEKHGIDLIATDERHGTARQIGMMWSGLILNVQVVVYGALLVVFGLNWWQSVLAIVVGNATWLLTGLCSLAGPAAGTTTFTINRAAFGHHGNRLLALFNWVMQIGYEVLDLALMSLAAIALFGIAGVTPTTTGKVAIVLVLAVAQSLLPILGHRAITKVLRTLIIPFAALFLVLAWLTAYRFEVTAAAPGSLAVFLGGVALVASGSGLGWCPNAADYSRYLPADVSKKALIGWVFVGGALPQSVLMLLGVAVAMVVPSAADPIGGLTGGYPTWFVVPYLVFVIVQMITVNAVDLYSSGVTLQAMGVRIGRWQAVAVDGVICAVVGLLVVLSGSFNAFLGNFLLFMIVWFAPWAGVFIVDYLLRRGHYDPLVLTGGGPGFVYRGLAAQAAGMVASLLWLNTTAFVGPLAATTGGIDLSAPAGLVTGALTYYLLSRRIPLSTKEI